MKIYNAQEQTVTFNGSATEKLVVSVGETTADELVNLASMPVTVNNATYIGYTRISSYRYDAKSNVYTVELERVSETENKVAELEQLISSMTGAAASAGVDYTQPIGTVKRQATAKTELWLTAELEKPMEYKGEMYTVTLKKQNLLSAQLGLYSINAGLGLPYPLSWNAAGKSCVSWEFADLLSLANAIDAYVKPVIKRQQDAEERIDGAVTHEEIRRILAEFE